MIRSISAIIIVFLFALSSSIFSQDKKPDNQQMSSLQSDELDNDGKKLDNDILSINKKIAEVITKYKLISTKDIMMLPYHVTYKLGDDFIEIEKYDLKRNTLLDDSVIGISKKFIRVYVSGQNVSRIESEISESEYGIEWTETVRMVDPSPTQEGTDDIIFTHTISKRTLLDNKKLGDIKNNRLFPLRNNLKREFLIPHITFFYNTILDIAESYYKGIKDTDSLLTEFLKKSTSY